MTLNSFPIALWIPSVLLLCSTCFVLWSLVLVVSCHSLTIVMLYSLYSHLLLSVPPLCVRWKPSCWCMCAVFWELDIKNIELRQNQHFDHYISRIIFEFFSSVVADFLGLRTVIFFLILGIWFITCVWVSSFRYFFQSG